MLKELYPERLLKSREFLKVQEALEPSAVEAFNALDGLLSQLFIDDATWGIELWEKDYGIEVQADKSLDYRRTRVKSKLRGQGTTTVDMIKNMAESFLDGEVAVFDEPDQYRIKIQFIGKYGIPPNLDDLSTALNEVMPAHIGFIYLFSYLLIKDLSNMTLTQLESTEINKFAF